MILSEREISWVNKIAEGKIQNFLDFADDSEFYNPEIKRWVVEPGNQYEFKRYLYSFDALLNKLESERLIYLADKDAEANFGQLVYTDEKQDLVDEYLNELMSKHGTIEIIPSEELNSFIQNNYFTEDEMVLKNEVRDRKVSQFLTVTIAIVSIVFSAVSC